MSAVTAGKNETIWQWLLTLEVWNKHKSWPPEQIFRILFKTLYLYDMQGVLNPPVGIYSIEMSQHKNFDSTKTHLFWSLRIQ